MKCNEFKVIFPLPYEKKSGAVTAANVRDNSLVDSLAT